LQIANFQLGNCQDPPTFALQPWVLRNWQFAIVNSQLTIPGFVNIENSFSIRVRNGLSRRVTTDLAATSVTLPPAMLNHA
jgi:hypothetical protein